MKILYDINCEGMGHATRSKAVIDYLIKQKHQVKIVSGERATRYFKKHYKDVVTIDGLHLWSHNQKISKAYTLFSNTIIAVTNPLIPKRVYNVIREYQPDLIISDYTSVAPRLAQWMRIPVVTLDNNRAMAYCSVPIPYRLHLSRLMAVYVSFLQRTNYGVQLIPSFYKAPIHASLQEVYITTPPLREELIKHKPTKGKHLLLYQTHEPSQALITTLKKLDHPIIMYGKMEGSDANITYKTFDEEPFFKDLSSAKAVIMNGSFTLMTEALHMKKPILSLPIIGQYEQEQNALMLERLGLGVSTTDLTHETLLDFLHNLPIYEENIKNHNPNISDWKKELDKAIKNLTA